MWQGVPNSFPGSAGLNITPASWILTPADFLLFLILQPCSFWKRVWPVPSANKSSPMSLHGWLLLSFRLNVIQLRCYLSRLSQITPSQQSLHPLSDSRGIHRCWKWPCSLVSIRLAAFLLPREGEFRGSTDLHLAHHSLYTWKTTCPSQMLTQHLWKERRTKMAKRYR